MMMTFTTAVEMSTGVSNSPDRRRHNGQPFATRAATARRCSNRASGRALDADLIRKTPTTGEDVVLRRAVVTTEIETPEPGPVGAIDFGARSSTTSDEHRGAATTRKLK